MASIPSSAALVLLFLLYSTPQSLSTTPPNKPGAFKCSTNEKITAAAESFLSALTETASRRVGGYATASVGFESDRLDGVMRCRSDLSPAACAACLRRATGAVSTACTNSAAASTWLDGCYLHYYYHHHHNYRSQKQAAHRFLLTSASAPPEITTYEEDDVGVDGEAVVGLRVRVWSAWAVGFACLVGVVLGAWWLRRRILSVSKVASSPVEDVSEEVKKQILTNP